MKFTDIIWPWGALRKARSARAAMRRNINELELRVDSYEYKLCETENRRKEAQLRLLLAENEIAKLRKLLSEGHFRNPATGRLGKKGQTYQ